MKNTAHLDTPCLTIDIDLLETNIKNMQRQARAKNKNVRPHAKTHKCSQICKMQMDAGAIGICVTKVSEAKVLADKQISNILITSPVVTPQKIETLVYCLQKDPDLSVVVDSMDNVKALNAAAEQCQQPLNILIDIDPGIGRTGIAYDDVLAFAKSLQAFKHLKLSGIQCYAGNLQHIVDFDERKSESLSAMEKAAECVRQLKVANTPCDILTGSGTGTYAIDLDIPEVTEIQPGSYTVMDSEYYDVGIRFEPAMKLLTTIISANRKTHVTCDAGWKSLYQVPTKPIVLSPPGLNYDWGGFGDEHGKITADNNGQLPAVGTVLELMVAHCDPTINLFDQFYIVKNNEVIDTWPIDLRGKSQ